MTPLNKTCYWSQKRGRESFRTSFNLSQPGKGQKKGTRPVFQPGYTTASGNRLTSDGTYNYEYDNEGNLLVKVRISDGQRTENTWDYRNRLTRIVVKDAQGNIIKEGRYTYDVDDRRIVVWEDADGAGAGEPTQRWTAYDGPNPWADFDENGSLTTRFLYGPAIDQLFARLATGQEPEWYLGDYLGSVRQIVRTDGTVLDEITYDSFGQILSETNPANGDRFKYTGREWDALFGQYYYRARYYGPDVGRFYSEDPLGFEAGDMNLYRYVENEPIRHTDPRGLEWYYPWEENAQWSWNPFDWSVAEALGIPYGPDALEGAQDGALMVYNALTWHWDAEVNNYVNGVIGQNGTPYEVANVFAHIGAIAIYTAGACALIGYNPVLWGEAVGGGATGGVTGEALLVWRIRRANNLLRFLRSADPHTPDYVTAVRELNRLKQLLGDRVIFP